MLTIVDVNLDKYQAIDLFRDVKELAMEQGVTFPNQLPKVVESLDSLQKTKEKGIVQFESPCEHVVEPSLTEVRMWADNLIVTLSSTYLRDPIASGQAQLKLKGSPYAIKKPCTSGRQKLKVKRPLPGAAKEKPIVCQFNSLAIMETNKPKQMLLLPYYSIKKMFLKL
ncbi:hypothetical protein Cgig2_015062 [Carnegiea gigantea]|uniref:Uncharacterized protein n=1 Tax=Carnegiea gigantea TaxID=171969 RepID=A0A9Q1K6K8_9CARY|nr:hypothetical protein Cgig2_015062 [Carnegiea gigantea]